MQRPKTDTTASLPRQGSATRKKTTPHPVTAYGHRGETAIQNTHNRRQEVPHNRAPICETRPQFIRRFPTLKNITSRRARGKRTRSPPRGYNFHMYPKTGQPECIFGLIILFLAGNVCAAPATQQEESHKGITVEDLARGCGSPAHHVEKEIPEGSGPGGFGQQPIQIPALRRNSVSGKSSGNFRDPI